MKRLKLLAGVAALAVTSVSMPAHALTFVLTPAAGAAGAGVAPGTLARQGFEIAAAYWSSVLSGSNVTMNLTIGFGALDPGVLAQAGSARTLLSMNQFYAAAAANTTSAIDAQAYANLPTLGASTLGASFGAVTVTKNGFNNGVNANNGYTDLNTRVDNDGSVDNSTLAITKASAKALGITTDVNGAAVNYASSDASITFSNLFDWDYNPTDGITSTAFDFIGVAIHEIGHALGFVSGVDSYDARTAPGQTAAGQLSSLEGFVVASQLDLFRYSGNGVLDWSTQGVPYFSVDGGANQLFGDSRFSTGTLNGDGRQASHFKDSAAGVPQIGVLDPTSARGQMQEVTALDLAAFDVIGWNLGGFNVLQNAGYRQTTANIYRDFAGQVTPVVPEPTTWMMMILGFGAIGFGMRRRNTKVAVTYA